MKRTFAKLLSLFVVLTLVIAMVPAVFAVGGTVSVTEGNTTLKVGDTKTISVKNADGADVSKVTLTSSPADIVSISGMTITAQKVGSATITATVTEGGETQTLGSVQITVQNKTDLAITSGKLLPLSGETLTERKQTAPADAEILTAVEYRDRLYDLADRFAVLDIPMLIDRSADEADALAQADWLRLYGILFGDETTAERMIREITSREG